MLAILLGLFRLIWLFGRGHHAVVLENLALRQQVAIYKRTKKRPRLVGRDPWFWIALSEVWKDWRRPLFVVHPDTVVRWQRERFRRYWAQRSKKLGRPGRPPLSRQVRELIRTMACANPLWRAPRIHGELRKLGIKVSERTVSRLLRTDRESGRGYNPESQYAAGCTHRSASAASSTARRIVAASGAPTA